MFAVEHRVRVFVFQVLDDGVQYLMLRRRPREEWPLGPAIGEVALHERIHDAVLREVQQETGIRRPHHLFELSEPTTELFGSDAESASAAGLVEWPIAYQAGTPNNPVLTLRPGPEVGEARWMGFEEAYHELEAPTDRDSIVHLRLDLGA